MLAKDEELYLQLKKKYLGVEKAVDMIKDLDGDPQPKDYLFMKLGQSLTTDGHLLNGAETMQVYFAGCQGKARKDLVLYAVPYGGNEQKKSRGLQQTDSHGKACRCCLRSIRNSTEMRSPIVRM